MGVSFAMPQLEIPESDQAAGGEEGEEEDADEGEAAPTFMTVFVDIAMNGLNYSGTEFEYAYALPGAAGDE